MLMLFILFYCKLDLWLATSVAVSLQLQGEIEIERKLSK